eukprot:SAG31_NODE_5157_length_2710_cov_4.921103_3_plen_111_part_00
MRVLATAAGCFERQAARELLALLSQQPEPPDLTDTKTGRLFFSVGDADGGCSALPALCSLQCIEHLFALCMEGEAACFSTDGGKSICPRLLGAAAEQLAPSVYEAAARGR